jgi:hypothetical protein
MSHAVSAPPPGSAEEAASIMSSPMPDPAWPLFYQRPELLSGRRHGDWRIRDIGVGFAGATNSVPVLSGEFAAAARCYPVVFAGPALMPVVLLGLEGRNGFVIGDAWRDDAYVPAYVRRYPFVFAEISEPAGFALAIDAAAPMIAIGGEEGRPLFDEGGEPSAMTRRALTFCDAFSRDSQATRAFVDQLVAQDLLVERSARVTRPSGEGSTLTGFSVVSPDAFAMLPESVVVDWHRKGWLAMVHSHLGSLARFSDLLPRQA